MKPLIALTCIVSIPLAFSACSSAPQKSNPILSHSANTQKLGKMWEEGNDLVTEGQRLIDKGNLQIKEGEQNLEKGLQMIEKGEVMIEVSESEFDQLLQTKPGELPVQK